MNWRYSENYLLQNPKQSLLSNYQTIKLTKALYVFLEVLLFVSRIYAGKVHPMESAVLLGLVPVCLQSEALGNERLHRDSQSLPTNILGRDMI